MLKTERMMRERGDPLTGAGDIVRIVLGKEAVPICIKIDGQYRLFGRIGESIIPTAFLRTEPVEGLEFIDLDEGD